MVIPRRIERSAGESAIFCWRQASARLFRFSAVKERRRKFSWRTLHLQKMFQIRTQVSEFVFIIRLSETKRKVDSHRFQGCKCASTGFELGLAGVKQKNR